MYNMQCTVQTIFNMCIRSLIIDVLIFILLIYFVVFTGKSKKTFGKTHREKKIHFHYLRVRSASLTNVRVRISNKNNGDLNISKRE